LRPQIGQAFARHLAVQQDEIEDILLQFAGTIEPDGRNPQALLVDVGMTTIGEVRMVREVDGPGDDTSFDEDRLGEHDVRQVGATALVSVVADEDVAGTHGPRPHAA